MRARIILVLVLVLLVVSLIKSLEENDMGETWRASIFCHFYYQNMIASRQLFQHRTFTGEVLSVHPLYHIRSWLVQVTRRNSYVRIEVENCIFQRFFHGISTHQSDRVMSDLPKIKIKTNFLLSYYLFIYMKDTLSWTYIDELNPEDSYKGLLSSQP